MALVVLVGSGCRTNLLDGGGVGGTGGSGGTGGTGGNGPVDMAVRVPLVHRPSAVACSAPGPSSCKPAVSSEAECVSDSDCVDGLNGRCGTFEAGCSCTYDGCAEDSDCSSTQLCSCAGDLSSRRRAYCADTNCHTDSDCGVGGYCSPSMTVDVDCGPSFWRCHTALDKCVNDSDCTNGLQRCAYLDAGYWGCVDYEPCVL